MGMRMSSVNIHMPASRLKKTLPSGLERVRITVNGTQPSFLREGGGLMTEPTGIFRNAATVILTRDGDQGMEVFLMRRHRAQSFMAGAFVFPGGALDEEDADPGLASFIAGLTVDQAANNLQEDAISPKIAFSLYMAAIRETFEEAGILLAYSSDGNPLQYPDEQTAERLSLARRALHKKELSLRQLAQQENIRFAFDLLTPFAHWMTPDIEKKRFDTRFFLTRIPPGQIPLHDAVEMTESRWLTPAAAVAAHHNQEIRLMPPTLRSLEDISGIGDTASLVRSVQHKKIYPILPQARKIDGELQLLLPHDPDYSIEGFKQPANATEPSRLALLNDRWQSLIP